MDISLECTVSLSKKLRAVIGESEGRVVLVVDSVRNGKGMGTLMISSDDLDFNEAKQRVGEETNIQFTPISVKDEVPTASTVSNLFSTVDQRGNKNGNMAVVDKIAVTKAPEKHQVAHAMKRQEEIIVPQAFSEVQSPGYQEFVSNMNELMTAVNAAQGKDAGIQLESIQDPRQRAVAMELKERAEAIDVSAFVVNDSCGSLRINDLDLSLVLNTPFDLSNISAKRIAASGELRSAIKSKLVKFIRPDEVEAYREKVATGFEKTELETYSTREDARQSHHSSRTPDAEKVYIEDDNEGPSEQEELAGLINFTSMGDDDSGVRRSSHGSNEFRYRKTVPTTAKANKQGISSIRKA